MEIKTIVISAVNIRRGGTLRILRDCLQFLSNWAPKSGYRVVAIVHRRDLCDFSGIEYRECPDTIKSWARRLWYEYYTMYKISEELAPIELWFSLHDTTPRVKAKRRAVYCQTSFPFLKLKLQDFKFDYKIFLFGLFTKFAYKINIHRNDFLVVQAEWLRLGLSELCNVDRRKFIVAPPEEKTVDISVDRSKNEICNFIYVCAPDCHKNIELVCEAAAKLEKNIGSNRFKVFITISGSENAYTSWIFSKWSSVKSMCFIGYQSKDNVTELYQTADCMIFPSRIETWGLPISEFKQYGKPMLLANLPYAHEAASGSKSVSFFDVADPSALAEKMKMVVNHDFRDFNKVAPVEIVSPVAYTWERMFSTLLDIDNTSIHAPL